MSSPLPRVKKKTRNVTMIVWILAGVAVALAVFVAYLVITQTLNPAQPTSIADRDIQLLRNQLLTTPHNATVLGRLAELEYEKGQVTEALRDGQAAVTYAADTPNIRLQFAGILLRENKPADAKKLAEAEMKLPASSNNADAYLILAQADRDLKDMTGALAAMAIAVKRAPVAADIHSLYGDMLRDAKKNKEAIAQYQLVLKFTPGDPHATEEIKKLGVTPSTEATSNPHSSAPATSGK